MTVAGIVIQTAAGAAGRVATRLATVEDLTVHAGDGESRLAAVWVGADGESLERFAERLMAETDEIVGIFPTFVGEE